MVKCSLVLPILCSPHTGVQLLNRPNFKHLTQRFSVCEHGLEYAKAEVENVINTMTKIKPGGVTPLTQHIWEIHQQVSAMAHDLRESGKQVAIILATDGLPTDQQGYGGGHVMDEFVRALRSLEGLPVWLVIRLCTDEDNVCEFYNGLDAQLELSLEVLDDYIGEANEVYAKNPWLTYGLPFHRCRELVSSKCVGGLTNIIVINCYQPCHLLSFNSALKQ
jgi:hypothetical protein